MFAGTPHELPERLLGEDNLTFVWSRAGWHLGAAGTPVPASAPSSAACSRAASPRCACAASSPAATASDPYDVIYQLSSIETLALRGAASPRGAARDPPGDARARRAARS